VRPDANAEGNKLVVSDEVLAHYIAEGATEASGGKMELLAVAREVFNEIEHDDYGGNDGMAELIERFGKAIARAESSQGLDAGGDAGKGSAR
jgi:hypothetical protein